jgi:subtilisin-like proprotein convertase family protein
MTINRVAPMPFVRTAAFSLLLLAAGTAVFAAVPDRGDTPESRHIDRLETRHYVLEAQHALRPYELQRLEAAGCEVQKVVGEARYVVRIDKATTLQEDDPLFRALRSFDPASKIAPGVQSRQAPLEPLAELNVLFHDDVTFDAAAALVLSLGGRLDHPLRTSFELPRRLHIQLPKDALGVLAADEAVYAVFGRSPRTKVDNAGAAIISNVVPLYSAPYSLSGDGVTVTVFDIGRAQADHREFGGRVTAHGSSAISEHPTHVSGTIGATGLDTGAKGMAPNVTIHQFDINDNSGDYLNAKETNDGSLHASVDSNSWGYILGWDFPATSSDWVWTENEILFGGYTFESAALDHLTRANGTLMAHSAGNDAANGGPGVAPFKHLHVNNQGDAVKNVLWCYDVSNVSTTNDCPASFTAMGCNKCEAVKHPANGPFGSLGLLAGAKDIITVGAVDNTLAHNIASFSSRGPTRDSRVKPDVVAKGVNVYSTIPTNAYAAKSGTSMATPVVSGISALMVEQWRKSFPGTNPSPVMLKTLLIQGAQDLGNPGPDYQYGFGLANAQASVDLIRADAASPGSRFRVASVATGAKVEFPFTLTAGQNVRVTLGWSDPENVLGADELAGRTLIDDLDLTLIAPNGATVMPYVLDGSNPNTNATRGRNNVDNTEQVEIGNAPGGDWKIVVTGTSVDAKYTPQEFVIASSAVLMGGNSGCSDMFEPNDASDSAFGYLSSGESVTGKTCSATDADFFKILVTRSGTVSATVTATDTPLKVTLTGGSVNQQITIAAGATGTVSGSIGSGTGQVITPTPFVVKIEPNGTVGANASYTLKTTFSSSTVRRRSARH